MQHLLNGLVFYGLMACIAAMVIGGATWAIGGHAGNYGATTGGRRAVLSGIVGALVIGAAPAVVNFFFGAGLKI